MTFFELNSIGLLTPFVQVFLITGLFLLTTWHAYKGFKKTGKFFGKYPPGMGILFAPISEEIIFRGFLLSYFLNIWSFGAAIVVSCVLFGLWHFKNIFWEGEKGVAKQMTYAALVAGPVFVAVTLWAGSIWPAVIAHYIHNLIALNTRKFFK